MAKRIAWVVLGTDDDRSNIRFLVYLLKQAGVSAKSTDRSIYKGHRALEIDSFKLEQALGIIKAQEGATGFWTWATEQVIGEVKREHERHEKSGKIGTCPLCFKQYNPNDKG